VTNEKDLYHLNMKFTIGLPPEAVFDILTTYENPSYFTMMKKRQTLVFIIVLFDLLYYCIVWYFLLLYCLICELIIAVLANVIFLMKEHVSSKVFSDLGPTEKHVRVEKAAPWRFLWWSGSIPVHLTFNESRKDFSVRIFL